MLTLILALICLIAVPSLIGTLLRHNRLRWEQQANARRLAEWLKGQADG